MLENPKRIRTKNARETLLRGAQTVFEAVSSTYGPRSANVAIARPYGRPSVIHDGVGVSRSSLPLQDPEHNVGAEIIFDAADKTNGIGDGTTLATILTYDLASQAHKYISAGARMMSLREGIEQAVEAVTSEVEAASTPVKGVEDILRIATVSAQNEEIGKMVADAYEELGSDGILTVDESRNETSSLELKTGMQFDKGWLDDVFATDGKNREAILEDVHIIITDNRIRDPHGFVGMLQRLFEADVNKVAQGAKPPSIMVIADNFDGEAFAFFKLNHIKKIVHSLAVHAPLFGQKRRDVLRDIATYTGGTLISEADGVGWQSVTKEMLGRASKVVATKNTTLIVDGQGAEEDIRMRVSELEEKLNDTDLSAYDREKVSERLAKLRSGVGVLVIGARSESEAKERRERAIDAVAAARAATLSGIVPGGGITLMRAAQKVREANKLVASDTDMRFGFDIVLSACEAPFRKLLSNAGYDPGEHKALLGQVEAGKGVDVVTGQIVDMVEEGIIDPTSVITAALGNAASSASSIYTSNTIITDAPREQTNERN